MSGATEGWALRVLVDVPPLAGLDCSFLSSPCAPVSFHEWLYCLSLSSASLDDHVTGELEAGSASLVGSAECIVAQ